MRLKLRISVCPPERGYSGEECAVGGFVRMRRRRYGKAAICFIVLLGATASLAQQPEASTVIRGIDAANQARAERVLGFTDIEHYAVFRGKDESRPTAEMTVKVHYQKGVGKSYSVLSASGPEIVRKLAFGKLLDDEKEINEPGKVEESWFTSANYEMKLMLGGPQRKNGRDCFVLAITPRRKAPNLIAGTLWVDARNFNIVEVQGMASKNPSIWAGPTRMMRQYDPVNGFAMATRARAESDSFLFGRTLVTVDYRDYHLELSADK